jgi:hypothetical protein
LTGTDAEAYDPVTLGWKEQLPHPGAGDKLSPFKWRKIYDTAFLGRSNSGYTFGDHLTEPEPYLVIEKLKKL